MQSLLGSNKSESFEISFAQSKVGNISISQICTHCKDRDSCKCIVNGARVDIYNSDISRSMKAVSEMCTTTLCAIPDPENKNRSLNIPCSGPAILYYEYEKKLAAKDSRETAFALSILVFVVALLVTVIVLKYF